VNEELHDELVAMAAVDQHIRERALGAQTSDGAIPDDVAAQWERVDTEHTARLGEIVSVCGWPTRSEVGADGSSAAWLLAQHADRQPVTQRRFLELLRVAVKAGQASAADLAYLIDRVAVNAGQEQTYGTQFQRADDGTYRPAPVADAQAVDARRAEMGLTSLATNTAEINRRYGSQ
jgi:hypothetical protein